MWGKDTNNYLFTQQGHRQFLKKYNVRRRHKMANIKKIAEIFRIIK